jgi:hypothetical protein
MKTGVNLNRLPYRLLCALMLVPLLSGARVFAVPIVGGNTSVLLTAASTLGGLGINVAPLGSATVSLAADGTPIALFPITGGSSDATSGAALIEHDGSGLALSNATATVNLENFLIDTAASLLSGVVSVGSTSLGIVPLFSIGSGLSLSLTSDAGAALSSVFGIPDLTGALIGTATVSPVLGAVPEPSVLALALIGLLAGGYARRANRQRFAKEASPG